MAARPPHVVFDTNVIIAALQSRTGASNAVLMALTEGIYQPHMSFPLYMQYTELLERVADRLLYTPPQIAAISGALYALSTWHDIHFLWRPHVQDPGDAMILELAVAANTRFILTFNTRHFRNAHEFGIEVVTPVQFLEQIGGFR